MLCALSGELSAQAVPHQQQASNHGRQAPCIHGPSTVVLLWHSVARGRAPSDFVKATAFHPPLAINRSSSCLFALPLVVAFQATLGTPTASTIQYAGHDLTLTCCSITTAIMNHSSLPHPAGAQRVTICVTLGLLAPLAPSLFCESTCSCGFPRPRTDPRMASRWQHGNWHWQLGQCPTTPLLEPVPPVRIQAPPSNRAIAQSQGAWPSHRPPTTRCPTASVVQSNERACSHRPRVTQTPLKQLSLRTRRPTPSFGGCPLHCNWSSSPLKAAHSP